MLKLRAEDGLGTITQLLDNICDTGEWPKDFTEVTAIALRKKPQATKCTDHRTISLIAHTENITERILRRRIERKTENILGEYQFGFRRGKGSRAAQINPLKTKRRPLYLKTQFVPRSKHFSSRL